MLTRTSFVFNYVTNLRRCNCGTYFIIFHCACAWTFSVFFDKISLNSIGFVGIFIVPYSECLWSRSDGWRPSRSEEHLYISNYFVRILRWYFTNREGQDAFLLGLRLLLDERGEYTKSGRSPAVSWVLVKGLQALSIWYIVWVQDWAKNFSLSWMQVSENYTQPLVNGC